MTGQFLTARTFSRLVSDSDTFDDFLQNVANFALERFLGHVYYPPADRPTDTLSDTIERLLNAIIEIRF